MRTNTDPRIIVRGGGRLRIVDQGVMFAVGTVLDIEGGICTVALQVEAKFTGTLPPPYAVCNVLMNSGHLAFEGGTTLTAPDGVLLTGGTLFVDVPATGEITATISTPLLTNTGADVRLRFNVLGQQALWSRLYCTGNVVWTGGTYYADTRVGPPADATVWFCEGTFTFGQNMSIEVDGGNGGRPVSVPIIQASGGFATPPPQRATKAGVPPNPNLPGGGFLQLENTTVNGQPGRWLFVDWV